ncbi:MAG: FecR domain-containing protein [Alphaproteobacteria bacterium]
MGGIERGILASALAVALSLASAHAAAEVGVAAAVNPQATGTPPNADLRVLQAGLDLFQDEAIVTGPSGRTQIIFLDGSALTLGPDSDIVLDTFVYDPDKREGSLVMSASKGVFRLVGGRISKKQPIVFKTASGRVAVRGGVALLRLTPYEATTDSTTGVIINAKMLFGESMEVTGNDGVVTTVQPNFEVTLVPGQQPDVQSIDPGSLEDTVQALELSSSDDGEQVTVGTDIDNDIGGSQITTLNSSETPQNVQQAPGVQGTDDGATPVATATNLNSNDDLNSAGEEASQTENTDPGNSTPVAMDPLDYGGRLVSQVPFVNFDFDTLFTDRVAARNFNFKGNTTIADGRLVATFDSGGMMNLPVQATGDLFSITAADGATSPFGAVTGNGLVSPNLDYFFFVLQEVTSPNLPLAFAGGAPSTSTGTRFRAWDVYPGFPGDSQIPFMPGQFTSAFAVPQSELNNRFWALRPDNPSDEATSVSLWAQVGIEGSGSSQRSFAIASTENIFTDSDGFLTIGGFARGSVRTAGDQFTLRVGSGATLMFDAEGNGFFGDASQGGTAFFGLDSDLYNGSVREDAAAFAQPFANTAASNEYFTSQFNVRTDNPALRFQQRSSRTLQGYSAGIYEDRTGFQQGNPIIAPRVFRAGPLSDQNTAAQSGNVVIQTDADTNRVTGTLDLREAIFATSDSMLLEFGQLTGSNRARSAFIDDQAFALRDSSARDSRVNGSVARARVAMTTDFAWVDRSAVPAGVDICDCDDTVWGFMLGDIRPPSGEFTRRRLHLSPWIAGVLPDLGALPSTGVASFDAWVFAEVANSGDQYVAFANALQTWNFASRTGTLSIENLDGTTFFANLVGANNRDFSGVLQGNGRTGLYNGSFFVGGSGASDEIGGQVTVTDADDPDYLLAGIVQGQRETPTTSVNTALRYSGLYVSGDPVINEPGLSGNTTGDNDPARYRAFIGATVGGGNINIQLDGAAPRTVTLPFQSGAFAAAGTTTPFGAVSGTAFVSADQDFFYYSFTNGGVFGGVPAVGSPQGARAYTLTPGFPYDQQVPFLRPGLGGDLTPSAIRPLHWFTGGGSRSGWGNVIISQTGGDPLTQQTLVQHSVASFFRDRSTNTLTHSGFARAYFRRASDEVPIEIGDGNAVAQDSNGNAFFGTGGNGAEFFVMDSDFYDNVGPNGALVRVPSQNFVGNFGGEANVDSTLQYTQTYASRTDVAAGVGSSRTSETLNGYTAGIADFRPDSNSGFGSYVFTSGAPTDNSIVKTAESNDVRAIFQIADVTATADAVDLYFGRHPSGGFASRSAFIDDDIFVMRRANNSGNNGVPGDGASFNDVTDARARLSLVTSYFYVDRSAAIAQGVTICSCEFLTWGFWAGEVRELNVVSGQRHVFAIAPWVVGNLPNPSEIQTTGTASFTGTAIANVNNDGDRYVAFGDMTTSWNFGLRTGSLNINGLDSANYAATIASANGRDATGTLTGMGRTGTVNTSFMRGGADPSGAIIGQFQLSEDSGNPYRVGGIVMGDKD